MLVINQRHRRDAEHTDHRLHSGQYAPHTPWDITFDQHAPRAGCVAFLCRERLPQLLPRRRQEGKKRQTRCLRIVRGSCVCSHPWYCRCLHYRPPFAARVAWHVAILSLLHITIGAYASHGGDGHHRLPVMVRTEGKAASGSAHPDLCTTTAQYLPNERLNSFLSRYAFSQK